MSEDPTKQLNGSDSDKLDRIIAAIKTLDARVQNVETRVEGMDTRQQKIELRLGSLEAKVDERLHDTRPMWEAVITRLGVIEGEVEGLRSDFRKLGRKIETVGDEMLDVKTDIRDLNRRVDKLESA